MNNASLFGMILCIVFMLIGNMPPDFVQILNLTDVYPEFSKRLSIGISIFSFFFAFVSMTSLYHYNQIDTSLSKIDIKTISNELELYKRLHDSQKSSNLPNKMFILQCIFLLLAILCGMLASIRPELPNNILLEQNSVTTFGIVLLAYFLTDVLNSLINDKKERLICAFYEYSYSNAKELK